MWHTSRRLTQPIGRASAKIAMSCGQTRCNIRCLRPCGTSSMKSLVLPGSAGAGCRRRPDANASLQGSRMAPAACCSARSQIAARKADTANAESPAALKITNCVRRWRMRTNSIVMRSKATPAPAAVPVRLAAGMLSSDLQYLFRDQRDHRGCSRRFSPLGPLGIVVFVSSG
jgi:hypothetical protein